MPQIKLPDGSLRQFKDPITVRQIAEDIGAGLANAALAGKVNNELIPHLVATDPFLGACG